MTTPTSKRVKKIPTKLNKFWSINRKGDFHKSKTICKKRTEREREREREGYVSHESLEILRIVSEGVHENDGNAHIKPELRDLQDSFRCSHRRHSSFPNSNFIISKVTQKYVLERKRETCGFLWLWGWRRYLWNVGASDCYECNYETGPAEKAQPNSA